GPRDEGAGRGRGDPRAGGVAARTRVRPGAGLPVLGRAPRQGDDGVPARGRRRRPGRRLAPVL
ncbi:MAG: hypothetical protein AVDCRST_MAG01-01-289, partial [uncultured Rubrobacteraceae bacterium]